MKVHFDPTCSELVVKMREIDPHCRIRDSEAFARFLAKTYQKPVADQIAAFFFKNYFSGEYSTVRIEEYYAGIEKFVNADCGEW